MSGFSPNLIILSHATYGATPAATYAFITKGYKPPQQARSIDFDVVHNQNGKFKYIYDNGPNFKKWDTFEVTCEEKFQNLVGANAASQYAHLLEMWNHPGLLGMKTPDGVYTVHWSTNEIEDAFRVFPVQTSDTVEHRVAIQLEEG